MFRERLLETLKLSKKGNKSDEEITETMTKIQNQERLTNQEFEKVYETIWKEGPKTAYKDPETTGEKPQTQSKNNPF